jgi:multisubunit Na+/H+ antiporter MnhC subunit
MNIHLSLAPLIALIAGILILIMPPRLLKVIIGVYLIAIGLIGLFGTGNLFR